ncbi:hypothetical protein ACFXPQ_32470 [Streptomyces lydicus]|uniref:hypothetical protein n=1 Tax=Streptomyces lydicus TaxID=47763 RepID=UPI0036BA20CA
MEPRELWERHAVLAQAFCSSDDEVRRTQGLLDEAEARRSRTLAAFAVTVGSDAVVAELLGLDEREVRLARRTVGKEDARAVAKSLLAQTTREQPPAQQTATPPATPLATPPTTPSPTPPAPQPAGPATPPPTAAPNAPHAPHAPQPHEPAWAPALDAVLMSSWHSGVDLTALATELGLDVRLLVARAQQLAAESRPVQSPPPDRTGRHRRLAHLPPAQQHESTSSTWRERPPQPPREPYEQEPWKQQPYQNYRDQQEYQEYRVYEEHPQQHPQHVQQQHPQHMQQNQQQLHQNQQHAPHQHLSQQHAPHQQYQQASHATWDANAITAAQHDWDGILSQWEATTSPTPPLSAPGQGGV